MAKAATTSMRAPRGTKPVTQAFFAALDAVPEASRSVVAKAAQAMIRDELRLQRDKAKSAAVKQKARDSVAASRAVKAAPKKTGRAAAGEAMPARRTRKTSEPAPTV